MGNYQAQQLAELSLVKGSRVMILEKSGDGWWRGQYGNKVGWFPSNYTQEEIDDPHTYCMAENVLDVMVKLKLPKQLPSGIVIPIADSNLFFFAGGALCI